MKMSWECTIVPSKRTGDEFIIKDIKYLKNKVRLVFSNKEKLEISNDTYVNHNFYVNKILTSKDISSLKKEESGVKDLNYATKLALTSIISKNEIIERLKKRKVSEPNIKKIIKFLDENKIIDESNNIKEKLEYYNYKNYGERKIKEELHQKGFKKEDINKIKFSYSSELRKAINNIDILNKKYKDLPYGIKKEKSYQFLLSKGFETEIINDALLKLEKEDTKLVNKKLKQDYEKALISYKRKYKKDELKEKIIAYLLRKGYRYQDIKEVLGGKL